MNFEIKSCTDSEIDFICGSLVEYNLRQVPRVQCENFIDISRKIVDENGNVIAGCVAEIYCWNIAWVDVLWVDEAHRKSGLGSRLLKETEDIAVKENCSLIHLDTFDFQAKDFYIKHGYEIFGTLEDCPEGHCRYYLKKKLGS
ncbi:MAG: GNAT family N-acetyltransferase [Oscillospiraceae bacterium]|nr:GNAT family N-acetyltransferase [Oscillospiraceae bacterium]